MFEGIKYKIIKKKLLKREIEHTPLKEIEEKHKNPHELLFNDSSYFNGIGDDGSYFLVRQSFRTTRGNEFWLEIFFPDLGLLRLKNHPGEEGDGFQQGNLKFDCLKIGVEWKVSFIGEMDLKGEAKEVEFDLFFKAITPLVDFHNAMILDSTARAIAKAKWSKSFFEKLKDSRKHHFEQGGTLSGSVTIDKHKRDVNWASMRDHSWGIRKWSGWKRHVWFGGMMENGQSFNLSAVEYDYMGQLTAGFITEGKQIHYLREFPMISEFASNPIFPGQLNLKLKYSDNKDYHLTCERKDFVPYDMDGEYRINEGISFGTVNGIKLKLVTEFGFNPSYYDI
jgi:hypothetical protein